MNFRGFTRSTLAWAVWPIGKLSISGASLSVHAITSLASVKKEEVRRIEFARGWLGSGIKVWNNPEPRPLFEFWSSDMPRILRSLELHGYVVEKKEPNQSPEPTRG